MIGRANSALQDLAHVPFACLRPRLRHDDRALNAQITVEALERETNPRGSCHHHPARRGRPRAPEQHPQVVDRKDRAAESRDAEQL